jgi:hypothetical protein
MAEADVLDRPQAARMPGDRVAGPSEPGAHQLAARLGGAESRGLAAGYSPRPTAGSARGSGLGRISRAGKNLASRHLPGAATTLHQHEVMDPATDDG